MQATNSPLSNQYINHIRLSRQAEKAVTAQNVIDIASKAISAGDFQVCLSHFNEDNFKIEQKQFAHALEGILTFCLK